MFVEIAKSQTLDPFFDKREMVLGPNKKLTISYRKQVPASFLKILAPRGQRIDMICTINFYSTTPECNTNIFYYKNQLESDMPDATSTSIHGAHYACNQRQLKISSRVPVLYSQKAPYIIIGNLYFACCVLRCRCVMY